MAAMLPTLRFFHTPIALATATSVEERRRSWTREYTTLVFRLWDERRSVEALTRLRDIRCARREEGAAVSAASLGELDAAIDRGRASTRDVERSLGERFPGMLQEDGSLGGGTFASRAKCEHEVLDGFAKASDHPQMVKDFARETVVVGGVVRSPKKEDGRGHFDELHGHLRRAVAQAMDVTDDSRVADALATAALRASWRTKIGADAWERATKHLAAASLRRQTSSEAALGEKGDSPTPPPAAEDDFEDDGADADQRGAKAPQYALVSRPTEPLTTIQVYADRVVATSHSHLCEVRCDADADDADDADAGARRGRCGDERAFIPIATRTTISCKDARPHDAQASDDAPPALYAERVVLSVVLIDCQDDDAADDDDAPAPAPASSASPWTDRLLSFLRSPD